MKANVSHHQNRTSTRTAKGNAAAIVASIKTLPPIRVLDPGLDTVSAVKKAKLERLRKKFLR